MGRAAPDHHHRFLTADVVPRLRTAGVSAGDLDRMLVENPRRILDYRKEPV
jgi:predicted metal-dependent phosphotriesterase family hydrolase